MSFLNKFRKREEKPDLNDNRMIVNIDPNFEPSKMESKLFEPQIREIMLDRFIPFVPDDIWVPEAFTLGICSWPDPLPEKYLDPYQRPMKWGWEEVPDDYHKIRMSGNDPSSKRKIQEMGYAREPPLPGVMRYRK